MPTPYTQIRTSHALTIKAAGREIGRIQSWAPAQGRDVRPKFEINAVGTGAPIENVPGVSTGLTISISRYDLYVEKMEEIWGAPRPLYMLTDQFNPIDIEEKWIKYGTPQEPLFPGKFGKTLSNWNAPTQLNRIGNSISNKGVREALDLGNSNVDKSTVGTGYDKNGEPLEIYVEKLWYSGCWFTSLGRQLSATGDRIVNVNATLVYAKVRPLL